MSRRPITSPDEDFPRWYQDVVAKADLAENGPVRGTMVIRPYGYAIWENIQASLDERIKRAGAQNVYLPLFIPESYLRREAAHVQGFSPELAVVTVAGGKELAEPIVVRPTSETLFGELMARWINSYRDLPLLLNQWANVVRWELRPRIFLRTSEFLWQEGHTAHVSRSEAAAFAALIHDEVYRDFFVHVLALPVYMGRKSEHERFAGAINTRTCEALMRDGKALQMATSHELGQNFARAFDIGYTDAAGNRHRAWTTSWGSSSRIVGGLIMAHGDEHGMCVPPRIAPVQVIAVIVRDDDGAVRDAARALISELVALGIRAKIDDDVSTGLGRRVTDWEIKGVPIRIQLGPRDLAAGNAAVTLRHDRSAETVDLTGLGRYVETSLRRVQDEMLAAATARRDAATVDVGTVAEAAEAGQSGAARIPWDALSGEGERELLESGVSVRCIQRPDGSVPEGDDESGLAAIVARAY